MKFRPHHFLCTLGFQGKGYSSEFVENFQQIADRLRGSGGEDVVIEVVGQTDSICAPCPNRRETACTSQQKIETLDRAHQQVLGLEVGQTLTWGEALDRIAGQVEVEDFHRICEPCSWKSLGICEAALKSLKQERKR